jgi:DNA end-binding protein Ku
MVQGDALVLELLRYHQEVADLKEFELPAHNLRGTGVTKKEIDLATRLIDGMTVKWNANKYHDEYRDALMKMVQRKIKSGQTEAIEDVEAEDDAPVPSTLNFMDVLKKSVEHTSRGRSKTARVGAKPRAARRARRPRKQRAG